MKTKCLILALSTLTCIGTLHANPYTMARVARISAYPPEIEIMVPLLIDDTLDVSGYEIYTSVDTAIINDGVVIRSEYFTFDSTNTSGFTINSEGDYIFINIEMDGEPLFYDSERFGNRGPLSPPLKGHPSIMKGYFSDHRIPEWPWFFLTFDFANPDLGWTDIIISEINAHSTWRAGSNFIELFNMGDEARTLDGWQIVCDTIYDLPGNAIIPAFGFYVIDENDFPLSFDMDISMDNIYLISPDSLWVYRGPRLVDQVGWSTDHGENVSFMRYPDGDVDSSLYMTDFLGSNDATSTTFENGFPTRGAANRHESPGFVVIGATADSLDEGTARIHWTDPIWDETFTASMLVKSHDDFVTTPEEGEIIYTGADQEHIEQFIIPSTPYYFTVFARDYGGQYSTPTEESQAFIYFNAVGIKEDNLPEKFSVFRCYPNPFNARTTISFSLENQSPVNISIYDIIGRLVDVLTSQTYDAGNHSLIWDAGEQPSGIYFARLSAGEAVKTNRMVLIK